VGLKVIQAEIKPKITHAPEQIPKAEVIQGQAILRLLLNRVWLTEVQLVTAQLQVMLNQNQVLLTINHTDRVQLTTEVQVQEVLHDLTVLPHQILEITEAVRRYVVVAVVAAEVTVVEEAAAEVVVGHIQVGQAEVLREVAGVLQEVVLHRPVAVNYRKQFKILVLSKIIAMKQVSDYQN
jgi:hypothetical protein